MDITFMWKEREYIVFWNAMYFKQEMSLLLCRYIINKKKKIC